jgi:hypothetical protein
MDNILDVLLNSNEPSIRYRAHVQLLSEDSDSRKMLKLREEIRSSQRVTSLLSERKKDGTIPWHPYAKWDGAHWVLAALADLGYPEGDGSLGPLREQVYQWLLSKEHEEYTEARPFRHHPPASLMSLINDRPRIHASMEGNAVWALLTLNMSDTRTEKLVRRLLRKQWPDGGWNCDGDPRAISSSFMETLLPLRALVLHAKVKKSSKSKSAAKHAAEVFLKRRLYKTVKNGRIIDRTFTLLHYPCYWHYDILFGLEIMAEAGYIKDERCGDALDLLETKRLSNGGFPAEGKYYRVTRARGGRSLVNWGPVRPKLLNEFVTVDALSVLKAAGRWRPE